jgi:hypothetical protein
MKFWKRIDRLFEKTEKKGFEGANKAHEWAINILIVGIAYQLFTFFRPIKVRPQNFERPEDN